MGYGELGIGKDVEVNRGSVLDTVLEMTVESPKNFWLGGEVTGEKSTEKNTL